MIAMALPSQPRLLIADEPTTALDVTVQAQVLRLMRDLQRDVGMAILYISHDLGVIARMADEVAVMYLGSIVEHAAVRDLFRAPKHPYTQALMASVPRIGKKSGEPLQSITGNVPIPINKPIACGFFPRCPVGHARHLRQGSASARRCSARPPCCLLPPSAGRWRRTTSQPIDTEAGHVH